jgi:hypothetical protein
MMQCPFTFGRELGPLHARAYVRRGLIETVSRATSAIRTRADVPLPDGVSADSAQRSNGQ